MFAADTATKSVCSGSCASAWPPATATRASAPG
jgi:predicted lipoprotein with Yx(FWY)xxD motif